MTTVLPDIVTLYTAGLPVALMLVIQLWAVFGTTHHPISMTSGPELNSAIVTLITESEALLTPTWPISSQLDATSLDQSVCGRLGSMIVMRNGAYGQVYSNFKYYDCDFDWTDLTEIATTENYTSMHLIVAHHYSLLPLLKTDHALGR